MGRAPFNIVFLAGLNLTECNNVILFDLWWNPAVEEQAFARAHRMGQTRTVNVYKLVTKDTVERRIMEVSVFPFVFCIRDVCTSIP